MLRRAKGGGEKALSTLEGREYDFRERKITALAWALRPSQHQEITLFRFLPPSRLDGNAIALSGRRESQRKRILMSAALAEANHISTLILFEILRSKSIEIFSIQFFHIVKPDGKSLALCAEKRAQNDDERSLSGGESSDRSKETAGKVQWSAGGGFRIARLSWSKLRFWSLWSEKLVFA
jgi:hypothetical protein